ncbi:MAG: type VI secretion system protein TssA [Pirellulales bacterium]
MTVEDLQNLLSACSGDSPAGQDLEYSPTFIRMNEAAEFKPDRQFGKSIVPAKEPDWRAVVDAALQCASQTRDIRVAVSLTQGWCQMHGARGLADGLELTAAWTTQFWSDLYPRLDATDGNDPTERLSSLSKLIHPQFLIGQLIDLPLVPHRTLRPVTLRDIQRIALAEYTADVGRKQSGSASEPSGDECDLEAVFAAADLHLLNEQWKHIRRSLEAFRRLDAFLCEQIGSHPWSGRPLIDLLHAAERALSEHIASRRSAGINSLRRETLHIDHNGDSIDLATHPAAVSLESALDRTAELLQASAPADNANLSNSSEHLRAVGSDATIVGATRLRITSREQATSVLDSVCEYFEQHEPASPVPLVLQRAKRMIPMSFVDILRELAPEGLPQVLRQLAVAQEVEHR